MEKFVVKHYSNDAHPSIKGNGFDGLVIGNYREEAEEFINFVNNLMAHTAETLESCQLQPTQVKTPATPTPDGEICPKCGNEMAVLGGSNGFSGAVCVVCD